MSAKRAMRVVRKLADDAGGSVEWIGGSKHRAYAITLPNGHVIKGSLSYGVDADENRTAKRVRSQIRREMRA